MIRLTKDVVRRILDNNEGFSRTTYREGNNFREQRWYTIIGGVLTIRKKGKTSWADSHYDDEWQATDEEAHRFVYKYKDELNIDI